MAVIYIDVHGPWQYWPIFHDDGELELLEDKLLEYIVMPAEYAVWE